MSKYFLRSSKSRKFDSSDADKVAEAVRYGKRKLTANFYDEKRSKNQTYDKILPKEDSRSNQGLDDFTLNRFFELFPLKINVNITINITHVTKIDICGSLSNKKTYQYKPSQTDGEVNSDGAYVTNVCEKFKRTVSPTENEDEVILELRFHFFRKNPDLFHVKFPEDRFPTACNYHTLVTLMENWRSNHAFWKRECPEQETIRKNYMYLIEELCESHLVPYLFQENVLSFADKGDVDDEPKRRRKIEMILDKVMRGCPQAFPKFLQALEEGHQHVAEMLRKNLRSLKENVVPSITL